MKRKIKIILVSAFVLIIASSSTNAEIITIAIEATVDWVNDPCDYLEGNIGPSDIITGTYIYDSDTPDSHPLPTGGDYWHYDSPFGISMSVGGYEFKTDPCDVQFLLEIVNDSPSGDNYLVRSYSNLPLSNGVPVGHISWQLDDPSGQAISSTDLTISAPILSNWIQPSGLRLVSERYFTVSSHVTSAVVIPEPVSIIAFGCAFIVMRKYGTKKHRRKQ